MKKKIGNNLSLKILSLAIAILVWLLVVNINNPISTKSFIVSDVELLNEAYIDADGKMCMQDEEQVPIRVTIKAQRKILDRITLNDIRAVADLQQAVSLKTDPVMVPITVSCGRISADNIEVSPQNMSLHLEDKDTQEFVVNVNTNNTKPDRGYEIGALTSNPEKIKITGPVSLINKIDKVNASIDVDGAMEDVTQETDVKIIDKNGEEFTDTDMGYLNVSKVYVTAKLWKVQSNVRISAEYSGTPAAGYQVESIMTTPNVISIAGSEDALAALKEQNNTIWLPGSVADISDRNSDFEPQIVPKYKRDISEIEGKVISMYARGMSVRQISDQVRDIYGFDVSEGMVTAITNKLLPEIEAWQKRPLAAVYPIVFMDAIVFNGRDNNVIRKTAAYVILGINEDGHKEVLSITIGENESAKFWLAVLNELKNRGVRDVFVLCADGLTGVKEAIAAAFPMTEYQRCIVHVVRNTLKYVADKDKKAFANDLKTIYHAPDEQSGHARMEAVAKAWNQKYPGCMNRWAENWDVISPMFKFSETARKVLYTTNAIESLNSGYRRLNRSRSVFPNDMSLLKALYLATYELTKKWTMPVRNWGAVYAELAIMYPGRLSGT